MSLVDDTDHRAARDGYKDRVKALLGSRPGLRVLELGGGCWPMFSLDELPATVASYTLNDIDPDLLARAPAGYETACFDVTGDMQGFAGRFDVVFSQFLAEHVRDGYRFHRNVHDLLAPGGTAIHLNPTLFAPPFVINKLMPERATQALVNAFRRERIRRGYPKFPAHYSYCWANEEKMRRRLRPIGFERISVRPFYGHPYYDNLPGLRQIGERIAGFCARHDLRLFASYAYVQTWKSA